MVDALSADRPSVDYKAVTDRQQATWASGDFHEISRQVIGASEALCRAVDPHPGQRVLDVACGSGNTALIAARRYCEVCGIDYVPALIERARGRAEAEGLEIDFRVADAQSLPYPDASFDAVLSVFGVMFAPDQVKAANELLRVTRPGGRIGLANWMPEDFGRDFFGAHARQVPPPEGVQSPLNWGSEADLQGLLGGGASSITNERRVVRGYARSIEHALEVFETSFGPTIRAREMIGPEARAILRDDLASVFRRYNVAEDGAVITEAGYLQTIAIRA